MKEIAVFRVDCYADREKLIWALTDSGYGVYVEAKEEGWPSTRNTYYVHVYEVIGRDAKEASNDCN